MASEAARAVLNEVAAALEPLNVPFALMGGLALAVWSYPRSTRDVDLLIGVNQDEVLRTIDALLNIGCRLKQTPVPHRVGEHCFVHLLYTPPDEFYDVQFDLMLAETALEKAALANSVAREVLGMSRPIHVLNCDDLILFKLVSGRLIDLADAAMLLRENRDLIDFEYFNSWISKLGLSREFHDVWAEAFPGESFPGSVE
jgi:Uncharacterised nucleotidyltransferase